MLISNQQRKRNLIPLTLLTESNLQWKKASKNLKNFIQTQHLPHHRLYQNFHQNGQTLQRKQKMLMMRSMESFHLEKKEAEKRSSEQTARSKESVDKMITKQKSYEKLNKNLKKQEIKETEKKLQEKGIQTFEEKIYTNKRNVSEENNCLKELISILEKQVLSYSKTISDLQQKILTQNNQIRYLKQSSFKSTEQLNQVNQKLKKQVQLNQCMEYIIAELNQKVHSLIKKNTGLQESIEEHKKNETTKQKLSQMFQDQQSSLSVNSQSTPKHQQSEFFEATDSIIESFEPNSLAETEAWSMSALEISCFNKTPNKVHQVQGSDQIIDKCPSSAMNFLEHEEQISEIIHKHKQEINKLKEKIKYLEIQNSMLRRKKEISQKNSQQVKQLKQRIQKLSQQNKIIKMIQQGKKKKNDQPNNLIQQKKESSVKKVQQEATKEPLQEKPKQLNNNQESPEKSLKKVQNDFKENEKTPPSQQKKYLQRKSPIQRKFVRKPRKNNNEEDDSEVSLSLSPQKI